MALWAPGRDPARTWTCVYNEACQNLNWSSCFSLSLCSSSSVLRACCSGSSNTLLKICCSGCCGNLSLLLVLSMIQHKLQKQQTTWAAWAMPVPKGSGSLGRNLPQPCHVLVIWLIFRVKEEVRRRFRHCQLGQDIVKWDDLGVLCILSTLKTTILCATVTGYRRALVISNGPSC